MDETVRNTGLLPVTPCANTVTVFPKHWTLSRFTFQTEAPPLSPEKEEPSPQFDQDTEAPTNLAAGRLLADRGSVSHPHGHLDDLP